MEYITVTEAAARWGITNRQIQRLLANGRIAGAQKHGRTWFIPAECSKPDDLRKGASDNEEPAFKTYGLVIINNYMPEDNPDLIFDMVKDEDERRQLEYEMAYFKGDFEKAKQAFYEFDSDNPMKMSACMMSWAAAVPLGDKKLFYELEKFAVNNSEDYKNKNNIFMTEILRDIISVTVFAPGMLTEWVKKGDFSELPVDSRQISMYIYAMYLQNTGQYSAMFYTAQAAQQIYSRKGYFNILDIYFRIMCASALNAMGHTNEAYVWMNRAMKIALPHGFITPFVELSSVTGTLLAKCLKNDWPDYYDRVMNSCEQMWKNWLEFHNMFTKDNITLILSMQEYQIAYSIANGASYSEVADELGLSVGWIRNIMSNIYSKLYIKGKSELKKFIL